MGLFSLFTRKKTGQIAERNELEQIAERNAAAELALSMLTAVTGVDRIGSLNVSPRTMLGVAAIFAAIRIRGETLANLPFSMMQDDVMGKVPYKKSATNKLLTESPDGEITAVEFFQTMESHSSLNGVAYAYIERNAWGEPVRLIQVPCYEVSSWVDDYGQKTQETIYNVRGRKTFPKDLIVIKFGGVFPYWQNPKPSDILTTPFALAQAIDKEAENLFANGCMNSGVLEMNGKLSDDAAVRLKKYLESFRNGGSKAGSMMILEQGLKYVSSRMTNKDAEFVELKKQSIRDVSAIYGVPSYRLGDGEKANYASQEEANSNFLHSTMLYRVNLFENEFSNKLLSEEEREKSVKIEANFMGYMRGSFKDMAEYYNKLFQMGAISPNTIARLEGLPPTGVDGDRRFVPANMLDLSKISKEV